jgi:uncharacterized membrane protein YdbT with pleckstrin-like domain
METGHAYISKNTFKHPALRALEPDMLPGEEEAYVATISPAVYWKAALVLLFGFIVLFYAFQLGLYILAIGGILWVLAYLARKYILLAATTHRVICQFGLFYNETMSISYDSIESVQIIRSLLGELLRYDNVLVTGKGRLRLLVPYVADGARFRNEILERRNAAIRQGLPERMH